MQVFSKQPGEAYSVALEFSGKLPTGASLNSGTVAAYDPAGTDVSLSLIHI